MTSDIRNLFSEFKNYMHLEERFVLLTVAEKGTIILSLLIIIAVLLVLASIMVAFLLMGLAHYIGRIVGGLALGYASVALIALILMFIFYSMRTTLVVNPLARLMRSLFVSTTEEVKS